MVHGRPPRRKRRVPYADDYLGDEYSEEDSDLMFESDYDEDNED